MKALISILLVFVICFCAVGCSDFGDPTLSVNKDDQLDLIIEDDTDKNKNEESNKEEGPVFDFKSWELRLVNPWNAIPEGFDPELALIDKAYAGFQNAQFDARAIDKLHELCGAAAKDGIKLTVISAYRTNEFQTNNFNRKVQRVMDANPALTREQAEVEAAKVVARPGTSEHQVGLAVDFNSVEDSFRNTNEYEWLSANCYKYGFILRYTAENQDKTGIIPEPWHYRYVGVEAATKIHEENICLEEFIEKYNTAK